MASKSVTLTPGVYTQLDTGVDTAIDAQNRSACTRIKIIFAASQPAVADPGDYELAPGEAIPRNGKSDLMWAMPLGPDSAITVGE